MKINYYKDPFAHSIIDNFFKEDLLEKICKHISELDCGLSKLPKDIEEIVKKEYCPTLEMIRYKLLPQMKEPWDNKDSASDYIIWSNKMDPNKIHKVHQDSEWKRLSVVVYLGEKNSGTLFHESQQNTEPKSEVEWKHNRAFAFVPGNNTWHSYRNITDKPRETVLINMGDAKHPVFSEGNELKY
tara:strand:- start:616 stop:1170 length:555 start_codon:yes stop_codon:yes gene_type:complete